MDFPIDSERLAAVYAGSVEPVVTWNEGPDGRRVPGDQETNDGNVPMWSVHCIVLGGDRPETIAVRLPAPTCPQPGPLEPAAFERLRCTARINKRSGLLSTYWTADGLAEVRRNGQHKPAESAA